MARLFVLGAGFSRCAGLPLGPELFAEVLSEARERGLYETVLEPDLARFCEFKERTEGKRVEQEQVDLEEFMAFLDVEHVLRLEGADFWSYGGSRSQQLAKNLIAQTLFLRQLQITEERWAPYVEFASRLRPKDRVLTFNYDTVLELSLERAGVPYRLVPYRFRQVWPGGGALELPESEVVVLKVHGSIDWFDIAPWERAKGFLGESSSEAVGTHIIFDYPKAFEPTPIIHEPYYEDSPLRRIRRAKHLEQYFSHGNMLLQAPLILAPSRQKLLYSDPLRELWWGFNQEGVAVETVGVVGYSLPWHDQYAVQALCALVDNFQHYDTEGFVHKTNLRMVDMCTSEGRRESLKARYRFVEWERADLWDRGFGPGAVDFLFAGADDDGTAVH